MNTEDFDSQSESRRLFALAFRTPKTTATSAPTTAEPLPFLRRHLLPFLPALPRSPVVRSMTAKAAKEHPAQDQEPERLPETDVRPAKQRRQQPVPQTHYDLPANRQKSRKRQRCRKENPLIPFHPFICHTTLISSQTHRVSSAAARADAAPHTACAKAAC